MKIGVITYPGTLDDRDAQRAIRLAGGTPVPLWHDDDDLKKVDAVVFAGWLFLRAITCAAEQLQQRPQQPKRSFGLPQKAYLS